MSLEDPPLSLRWRAWCRAFGFGCLVHLTLPDAHRVAWIVPNVLLGAAALSLLAPPRPRSRRFVVTFAAVALSKLASLVFGGDQLTQSVVLLLSALSALALVRAPTARDAAPHDATHAHGLRLLFLGVYGLAAFHKTNRDFLDPTFSCATGGMRLLAENWSLPLPEGAADAAWPHLFLATEAALVVLGGWRPAYALLVALLMHLPLTIVFAPAFAWVMLPGWLSFLRDEDLAHLRRTWQQRRRAVLALGLAPAAASATLYFRDHWVAYPAWQLVELSLWLLLALYSVALVTRRGGALMGRLAWSEARPDAARPNARHRRLARIPLLLLLAVGATPYLGVQFHHAGAMLSNLRVDEGCWNHLVIPESVRWRDPYVRVEAITPGPGTPGPEALATHARSLLWNPASLREAVARWCEAGAAPLALELRYHGRSVLTDDACVALPLPWEPSGLFQTNLPRECPARCIH